jgi:hypothetical protein
MSTFFNNPVNPRKIFCGITHIYRTMDEQHPKKKWLSWRVMSNHYVNFGGPKTTGGSVLFVAFFEVIERFL